MRLNAEIVKDTAAQGSPGETFAARISALCCNFGGEAREPVRNLKRVRHAAEGVADRRSARRRRVLPQLAQPAARVYRLPPLVLPRSRNMSLIELRSACRLPHERRNPRETHSVWVRSRPGTCHAFGLRRRGGRHTEPAAEPVTVTETVEVEATTEEAETETGKPRRRRPRPSRTLLASATPCPWPGTRPATG